MTDLGTDRTALAAALAAGVGTVGRSHRLHRRRGGFCGRGYCQQCPLRGGGGLACETPAGEAVVRSGRDPLRLAGLLGERMEPWFYERRFLRPAALRQPSLRVLRRLSAAPSLPAPSATPAGPLRELVCDVLVVGGGPAGLAAAAATATAARVTVVTRGAVGGSLPKDGAVRAGLSADAAAAAGAGAVLRPHTFCLGLYPEAGVVAAIDRDGPIAVKAERIVVATGAYDRPIPVAGVDLPGVIGIRAFELLGAQGAFPFTRRIGLVGGPAEVARGVAAAETFRVPLGWVEGNGGGAARPIEVVEGGSRVRAVTFEGGERRRTDVLVLGFTQPTFELQLQNGLRPRFEGSPPVIRTEGRGRLPMLVVGEAAGWFDPAVVRETASGAARAWIAGDAPPPEPPSPFLTTIRPPPAPDAIVCVCEDVRVRDLDLAIDEGFHDVELLKRRSGAATGACQGKLCLGAIAEVLDARSLPRALPTVRPPIRPVGVASLGGTVR